MRIIACVLSAAVLASTWCLTAFAAEDPTSVVTSMISSEIASPQSVYFGANGSSANMQKYFSGPFVNAYTTVENYSWPAIDFDALTGTQQGTNTKLVSAKQVGIDATRATVTANLTVTGPDGTTLPITETYSLVVENGQWKIDDVDYGNKAVDKSNTVPPTIRGLMVQAIGIGPNG